MNVNPAWTPIFLQYVSIECERANTKKKRDCSMKKKKNERIIMCMDGCSKFCSILGSGNADLTVLAIAFTLPT